MIAKDSPADQDELTSRASRRLLEMIREAQRNRCSGWHGVELLFRGGEIKTIRCRTESTET